MVLSQGHWLSLTLHEETRRVLQVQRNDEDGEFMWLVVDVLCLNK